MVHELKVHCERLPHCTFRTGLIAMAASQISSGSEGNARRTANPHSGTLRSIVQIGHSSHHEG